VLAFFGLSGFFIHKSLAKSFAHKEPGSYVSARVNRIVPPFLFALALVLLFYVSAHLVFASGSRTFLTPTVRTEFSIDGLLPTLVFLNGFTGPTLSSDDPLWSLSYEVWYYAAAFVLALLLTGRWIAWIGLPALGILGILNPAFVLLGIPWALGFLVSILHANDMIPRLPQWPFWAAAAIFAYPIVTRHEAGLLWTLFRVVFGVAIVVHLSQVLRTSGAPRIPVLPRSAAYSYTLYVIHYPILLFAYGVLERVHPIALAGVGVAVLAFAAVIGPRLEQLRILPQPRRKTDAYVDQGLVQR
jgi:peptidoglycan/LPS O-acetylase OafA/YrhL